MELAIFLHHVMECAREQGQTLPQALAWVKSLGYDRVEAGFDDVPDPAALRRQLDDAGLGVSSVYAFFDWGKHPEDQRNFALLDAAEVLGSPMVMPIPGLYAGNAGTEEENRRFLEGMAPMAAEAQKRGLIPTLEPFDNARSPIATVAGMERFFSRFGNLAVTLDTGNFRFSGEDVLWAQQVFRGRIRHVHLKDRLLTRPEGMPMENGLKTPAGETLWPCAVGDGDLPIRKVIDDLMADGYDHILSIEHFGAADWKTTIARSMENVKAMLGA